MKTIYKVLASDGTPCHGGSGKWFMPKGKRPGKWMPAIKDIQPCARGYHFVAYSADYSAASYYADPADAAEKEWQFKRLKHYLGVA